ncbi:MAG: hypothetical protein R3336_07140 [Phycisphaeraceae bacterium]|nr:hypothetical protein [Phycisphaeraceae bacterium]
MAKSIIFAVVAGLAGALGWGMITYFTNYEIGLIAWGIGLLVGFAAMLGAGDSANQMTGGMAALIAIVSIVGGKYLAVEMLVDNAFSEEVDRDAIVEEHMNALDDDEYLISFIADEVAAEKAAAGESLDWPGGEMPEDPSGAADYPEDVWAQAQQQWDAMTAEEQEAFREETKLQVVRNVDEAIAAFQGAAVSEGFAESFSIYDLLFFALGAFSAFKIGAGDLDMVEEPETDSV